MFIAFVAVLLVASVPLAGGRLGALAGIRLRLVWVLFAALLLQILVTDVLEATVARAVLAVIHVATYVMAGAVLWANRRLPGLLLVGLGGGLNALAIALNGGTLPASASALRRAGWDLSSSEFSNSGVLAHPVLAFLGDNYVTPGWLPFSNVVSIGDVLALLGTAILLHAVCGTRLAKLANALVERGRAGLGLAVAVPATPAVEEDVAAVLAA